MSNPTGNLVLGTQKTVTLTIIDNDTVWAGFADVVLDYFDSGAGPIPGPYGFIGSSGTTPINLDAALGNDPNPSLLNTVTLPTGSYVTLGFIDETIIDGPGNDIFVREDGAAGDRANVFVSSNLVDFTFLGVAQDNVTTAFDLSSINYTEPVRAVKIIGLNLAGSVPGFDLVNVQALNQGSSAGKLSFETANFSINENGTPVTEVKVIRTDGSYGQVSATINVTNGTANAGSDYNNTPITVTFANGEISKIITIPIVNDLQFEPDETINLTLTNTTNGATLGTQATATLTIVNDDPIQPGTIAFSSASYSVNENGTLVTNITLNRTGGSDGEVSVILTPSNGTATAESDYNNSPITVNFADGETSQTVTIPINNDTVYEPTETINLTLSNATNGATLGTQTTAVLSIIDNDAVPGVLSFSNATHDINENGTPVTQVTINRAGGSDGAISAQILLTNGTATSGSDYVATPITVNFANGETSKTVTIPIINDTVLENTETINLTLTNPTGGATINDAQKSAIINILDDDFKPTLTVTINPQQVTEGNTIQGTVTRNTDTTQPLTVTLVNSENSQITVPTTVTIPVGATSANFNITAVDDTLIELPKNYTIIASAAGFVSSSNTVAVIDNDGVNLTLTLAANSISENGGKVQATVTRNIVTNTPLEIQLSSSDTTEATVPQTVIIPANQASATFEIQGVDDTILDGTQGVIITAKPTYTGTNITVDAGQATANLNVTDNESPSLTLTLDKNIISETGTATATITRNTPTTEALTVTLTSSDTTEATVPATVTIPVGQTSATFIVTGVNDGVSDGIQTINLTASANGFNSGVKTIEVSDIDVPNLQITNLAATTNPIYTGKQSYLTYKVENLGLTGATGTWTDKVYLSTDNKFDSSDTLITETTFTPDIPFNSFYERNIPFFAPKTVGQYYLIATTDANNTVNEGTGSGEQNNTVITPITVIPAYKATVYTDTVIGTNRQAVTLRGSAVNNADNSPVPFEFVTIKIENNGTIRELSAFTDGNGNFVKSFNPLPTEGGQYNINAYFPNNPTEDTAPEDSFQLLGMKFNTSQVTNKVIANTPFTGTVTLENITNIGITGITATVDSLVPGWNVQVNTPQNLAGSGNNTLSYTITAPNDSYITQDTFNIKLTSTEGATAVLPVNVNLERIVPRLVVSTNLVSSGMLRGNQTLVEFQVTNEGGGIAKNIEVELPNEPWLKLASPATISALNPGESTKVTLLLNPDANLPLTEYFGNFFLDAEGNDGDLSVNYNFRAISEAKGNIRINTVDELFYFAEGAPKLAGATVTLRDYFTNEVIATAVTDNTGLISLSNINEGYYNLEIKADKHDTFRQTIQLDAGETENINAFLSRQTVQYKWTVTPTEIEDKYNITVESVFETDVPIPTVVVDPPLIDLEGLDVVGQVMQVDMTLTNHGLIAANNVALDIGTHPFYKIEPLVNNIVTIGAKSSLTIPVRITRIADFDTLDTSNAGELQTAAAPSVSCSISARIVYDYECAGQKIKLAVPLPVLNVSGNCFIGVGGIIPFGGTASAGSGRFPTPIIQTYNCDPCGNRLLQAIIKCAIRWIPMDDWEKCAFDSYKCATGQANVNNDSSFKEQFDAGYSCTKATINCLKALGATIPLTKLLKIVECGYDIANAGLDCLKDKSSTSQISFNIMRIDGNATTLTTSNVSSAAITQLNNNLARLQKFIDSQTQLFGDVIWLQSAESDSVSFNNWLDAFDSRSMGTTLEERKISDKERTELLNLNLPAGITGNDINRFLDRWNRTMDYWSVGNLNLTEIPTGQNTDFLAFDVWTDKLALAIAAFEESKLAGYADPAEQLLTGIEELKKSLESGDGSGVCATVRLKIDQEAVMTRSAFLGNLEIDNGNQTNLTNLAVNLKITDQNGNIVNNLFGITNPTLKNITAVDGTGILIGDDPNTPQNEGLGSAEWTFIPTNLAAPQTATTYNIGGTLSYTENGQVINVPLLSTGITVLPQAELYLDYFQSRNVYGDDPFTDATEISVPFDLAVLVQNKGYGDAKNLRITSSQPKIVDNEKGLLIDFNIIGSQLNGQDVTPSLAVNFGDIKAGQTAVANWLLKSTLQGKFIEYSATFEHVNGLGNKELSLIKEVKIHELIQKVAADGDNLPDFLVNDEFDAKFYPDTLYFSDGTTAPVTTIDTATVDAPVTIFDLEAQITVNSPLLIGEGLGGEVGWTYITLADPADGQFQIKQLLRSDGTLINLDNIWRTDRTFPATGRPIYENILHFLDKDSTGSYTIIYDSNDNAAPQVREIVDVSPNPRNTVIDSLTVVFTESIRANTFDYQDLSLTLDGGANLITNGVTINQIDPITFQINNLTGITGNIGQYQLSVNATGIQDLAGNAGAGIVNETWTFTGDRPGIASIIGFNSTLLNTTVNTFDVTFTEAINPSSFDYTDITLRRNNGESLVNNTVTITQIDATTFRVGNFAPFTNTEGDYQLLVTANGVQDTDGNNGVGGKGFNWVLDNTIPTLTSITNLTSPRNTAVTSVEISFSEAINQDTLNFNDLTLTRDGSANLITNGVTLEKRNETTYTIKGLSGLQTDNGVYTLTVNGTGIQDAAGNSVSNSLNQTWTLDRILPGAPTNIQVTSTPLSELQTASLGILNQFGQFRVNSQNITITGNLPESNLRVYIKDLTTNQDLGQANVTGTQFSGNIQLPSPGSRNLEIRVQDAAENASTATLSVFADVTKPAITQFLNIPTSTPNPINGIEVQLSEQIDINTFDKSDITLTRDGVALTLPNTVIVEYLSGTTYRINGLNDLTTTPGTYSLQVDATTIQDNAGNSGDAPKTATFTIAAPATPGITQTQTGGNTSVTEAGNTDSYSLVLKTQPTADVTINLAAGNQITLNQTSLTFTPSNWNIVQTVTVTAVDDALTEGAHTATITHTVTSADGDYNSSTIPNLNVSIQDNDAEIQGNVWNDVDGNAVNNSESGLTGWTVYIDANNNSQWDDGELADQTDADGNYQFSDLRPGTYTVAQIVQDGWQQTYPIFSVSTTGSSTSLSIPTLDFIVLFTDGPTELNFSAANYLVNEDGTALTEIVVTRSGNLAEIVSATLTFADGTATGCGCAASSVNNDFNYNPITITFAENEVSKVITVQNAILNNPNAIKIRNDDKVEGNEYFTIQLTSPTNNAVIGNQATATVTILDNESPSALPNSSPTANTNTISSSDLNSNALSLINLDDFWADRRFTDITGRGYSTVIIDTGIDLNHPLFGPDLDNNGIADKIVYQYDFADNDSDASDKNNHGSHVASIAAQIAPDSNLIVLKVFGDDGSGYFADLEAALQWVNSNAATYNIASVNLSLGDSQNWTTEIGRYGIGDELAAIASQNILIAAAAGNSFYTFNSTPGLSYPAADPNVISVGAVWADDFGSRTFGNGAADYATFEDAIASFSQRHPLLDVFAPGILITGANATGGTISMGGTSQATPYISAIATLSQQIAQTYLGRELTLTEFKTLLDTTSDLIIDGDNEADNVVNTGNAYPRVNVLALGEAILTLGDPSQGSQSGNTDNDGTGESSYTPVNTVSLVHTVTLTAGQVLENINFGNINNDSPPDNHPPSAINFLNPILGLAENTTIGTGIKVAELEIIDDGLDNNILELTGADAASFTIQGTALFYVGSSPDFETKNQYQVTVTVDDPTVGNTPDASTNFTLTILDVNEAPFVQTPLDDQTVNVDSPFNFTVPADTFSDEDGDTLFYTAVLPDGTTPLPPWLSFNDQTLTFSGTPGLGDVGTLSVGVFANDGFISTFDVFDIVITSQPGTIQFNNSAYSVNENGTVVNEIILTRTGGNDGEVSVTVTPSNGTATSPDDFDNTAITVNFTNGETSKTVAIPIVDDTVVEGNETVNLTLSNATGGAVLGSQTTAVLTIIDNEPPPVNLPPSAVNLLNPLTQLAENTPIGTGIKVAEIQVTDDGLGTNTLSLTGTDAASFAIENNELYFVGTSPDFETQAQYQVTVNVDDPTVGNTPDASTNFALEITNLFDSEITGEVTRFTDGELSDNLGSLVYDLANVTENAQAQLADEALQQTDAAFHNLFGLYEVQDTNGAVLDLFDANNNGSIADFLNPGDTGYARSALSQLAHNFILQLGVNGQTDKNSSASDLGDILLNGGKIYAPFAIANGGALIPASASLTEAMTAFLDQNPENTAATLENYWGYQVAYFSFGVANPDGAEHLQSRGEGIFGFEDLPGNLGVSDFDFNDAVFQITFLV